MNYCENCGSDVQDGRFCSKCGHEVGMLPKSAILTTQNWSATEKKTFFEQYHFTTIERKIVFWIFLPFFYIFYVGRNLVEDKNIPRPLHFVFYILLFYIGSIMWFMWAMFLAIFPLAVLVVPFMVLFNFVVLIYLCLALAVFSPFYIGGYLVYKYIWEKRHQSVQASPLVVNPDLSKEDMKAWSSSQYK